MDRLEGGDTYIMTMATEEEGGGGRGLPVELGESLVDNGSGDVMGGDGRMTRQGLQSLQQLSYIITTITTTATATTAAADHCTFSFVEIIPDPEVMPFLYVKQHIKDHKSSQVLTTTKRKTRRTDLPLCIPLAPMLHQTSACHRAHSQGAMLRTILSLQYFSHKDHIDEVLLVPTCERNSPVLVDLNHMDHCRPF